MTRRQDWKDKDTVEVQMPCPFHLNRVLDQPHLASLWSGPVLLAAEKSEPRSDCRPVTLDAADLGRFLTGNPAALRFDMSDVALRPFCEMYGRCSVCREVKAP